MLDDKFDNDKISRVSGISAYSNSKSLFYKKKIIEQYGNNMNIYD